jgi:hypothetical protein
MMSDIPKRRGRPPKTLDVDAEAPQAPVMRTRHRNIIGTAVPYHAPAVATWTGTALGFRPKAKKSRPLVQPNPV